MFFTHQIKKVILVEDSASFEPAKSIEDKRVHVPLIVRDNPYGDGYEIIAGYRRQGCLDRQYYETVVQVSRNRSRNVGQMLPVNLIASV